MPKPARPAYHLYRWLWGSLDFIFPPNCGGCGRRGALWCAECQSQVRLVKNPYCEICGQPGISHGLCPRCSNNPPKISAVRSWAIYEGSVRHAIRQLKYNRNMSLGLVLARRLSSLFIDLGWDLDLVIPVPLGVARLRERGYNQAVLIARPFALELGIPYSRGGLKRVRETRSQVGLNLIERQDNVRHAFAAAEDIVGGKRILVIDDVTTSGATLSSCGEALCDAGARAVFAMTLARTE